MSCNRESVERLFADSMFQSLIRSPLPELHKLFFKKRTKRVRDETRAKQQRAGLAGIGVGLQSYYPLSVSHLHTEIIIKNLVIVIYDYYCYFVHDLNRNNILNT